jgi:hypothetical protein
MMFKNRVLRTVFGPTVEEEKVYRTRQAMHVGYNVMVGVYLIIFAVETQQCILCF